MFRPGERYGKYAVVSEAGSSDPGHRVQAKRAQYYAPFSTRLPALALILIAILGCIGTLEYGLRAGLTVKEKEQQQTQTKVRRQVDDTSSSAPATSSAPADTSTVVAATSADVVAPTSSAAVVATALVQSVTDSQTPIPSPQTDSTIDSDSYISQTDPPSTSTPQETNPTLTGSAHSNPTTSVGNVAPPTPTTTTMAYTTGSGGTGVYISPGTTIPVSSSTTPYQDSKAYVQTTLTSDSKVATEGLTTTTTAYITPAKTAPTSSPKTTTPGSTSSTSTTVYIAHTTTAYITPVAAPPTSSSSAKQAPSGGGSTTSTTVMKGSTTPYVAVITTYVAQSTTPQPVSSTTVKGVSTSPSSKSANPYTVPASNTAPASIRTTSVTTSRNSGHDSASALVAETPTSSRTPDFVLSTTPVTSPTVMGLRPAGSVGPDPSQTQSAVTTSADTLAISNYQIATVSYTSTDASGKVFTVVNTETYGVVITTQTIYDATGGVSTIVAVATLTSYSDPSNTAVLAENNAVPTTPPDHQRGDEVELGLALSNFQYFRATYLPVLVAVILRLIWTIVFVSTKMMEPFYLLSRKGGASAKESLLADYLTTSLSLESIKDIFVGHPIIILVTVAHVMLSILPSVATQCTVVRAIGWCRDPDLTLERCNPMWYLNINYARAIQAVLAAIAVIIVAMIAISMRRRSGVFSNPSTIATVASLLNNEEFMQDLQAIDRRASRASTTVQFGPSRYVLGDYQTYSGCLSYGIARTLGNAEEYVVDYHRQQRYSAVDQPSFGRKELHTSKSTFSNRFLVDTIFLLSILALLGVLVGYYMDGKEDPFNNFFNHNSNSRLVLTCVASLIDIRWKQLEQEVRLLTPYRRLFLGSAKPKSTILVSQNSTPLTSIFQAVWRRNFFHAFVAFVAILSDMLILTVGGVPYNSGQIWLDFLVSIYSSWAILAIMVLTVLAMFRWRALNEKMMMPREPTTLLRVLLLLCNEDNVLRQEMQGYETLGPRERDRRVTARGGLYWAGWLTQPDGSQRWCVDKESGPGSGMNMIYKLPT